MKMNIVLAVLMCGLVASAETFSRVAADVSALPESARFIEKILKERVEVAKVDAAGYRVLTVGGNEYSRCCCVRMPSSGQRSSAILLY